MQDNQGVPAAPSGHSGSAPSPDGLGHPVSVPNADLWTVAGTWPWFLVERTDGPAYNFLGSANDTVVNGTYPSKVEALESLVANLCDTRRQLSEEIAKHKRDLRRAIAMETRRAETTGSVAKR